MDIDIRRVESEKDHDVRIWFHDYVYVYTGCGTVTIWHKDGSQEWGIDKGDIDNLIKALEKAKEF